MCCVVCVVVIISSSSLSCFVCCSFLNSFFNLSDPTYLKHPVNNQMQNIEIESG